MGGSRIPPDTFERALGHLGPKIGVLYGLTEAPVTCYLPPQASHADRRARQAAFIPSGACCPTTRCVSHGSDERQSTPARSGEVLIRGGNVMAGYWKDERPPARRCATAGCRPAISANSTTRGNLQSSAALKDVIRSGSSTIVPKEVEDVIAQHPAVAEVAVIGLPDAEWGEAVTAFVVTKPGMSVAEDDLVEHCRTRLASYKKPRAVRFVASLPRSHYGKVLRAQLIAEATD